MKNPTLLLSARNYLKTFLRVFIRNRSYSVLNLLGLSLGYGVFIFALIYVYFETHFESFNPNKDQIYRATYQYTPQDGFQTHWARVPFDYINELPNDVQGIKHLVRFQNHERKYIRVGTEKFRPEHAYVTDKEVFQVFGLRLLEGDPATALASPHSIVLSQSLARRYFGDQNPMGKEIFVIGDLEKLETLHQVTGVIEDLPANTHLPINMLISYKNDEERAGWAYTYILLDQNTKIAQVQEAIPQFIRKYSGEDVAKFDNIVFQPLTDIHLHSNIAREIVPNGKIFYVRIVGLAGLFILIIAAINFMNLNSAMALGRAKEIGMRKIMGASRAQLIGYLLTESVLYNIAAAGLGAAISYGVFPLLHQFIAVQFLIDPWSMVLVLFSIALVCGLAAGIYPVILLVALKPMDVVRTSKTLAFSGKESPMSLKRIMVTLQFGISILLLGSALIAYQQFRFLHDKNLGMKREAVLAIPGVPNKVTEGIASFKNELQGVQGVMNVAACMEVPSREIRDTGPVLVEGVNMDPSKAPIADIQVIDHDLVPLLGLEFVAGQNISPAVTDAKAPEFNEQYTLQNYLIDKPREYIINETAMRLLGWQSAEEAVGQRISWSIGDFALAPGPIRGVVKDFHQETLKNKVDPVVMVNEPIWLRTILIKVSTDDLAGSLQQIQATWDKLFPYYPLEYHFLDELYENLYKGERTQLQLLFIFSALAIVIAFMGLLGLITYALKTRMKELAVRKVLGASLADLVGMMSKEYMMILLVGSIIAIPLSVYGINEWLSDFAYHVEVTPVSYVVAVGLVLLLLVTTIALQTFKTGRLNPADTLRDE